MPDDTQTELEKLFLAAGKPQSLYELKVAVGVLFHCMVGPPQAYFEIPIDNGHEYRGELLKTLTDRPFERFVYVSVGWEEPAEPRGQAVHQRLIDRMWEMFCAARTAVDDFNRPTLFWRRELEFDDVGDFSDPTVRTLRICARVVIPGFDLRPYQAEWSKAYKLRSL